MIERLIGKNKWGSTGWRSYNEIKTGATYYSHTWRDETYVYLAVFNVGMFLDVDVYRQPYLKAV